MPPLEPCLEKPGRIERHPTVSNTNDRSIRNIVDIKISRTSPNALLFMPKCFDRIQIGRLSRWVNSEQNSHTK